MPRDLAVFGLIIPTIVAVLLGCIAGMILLDRLFKRVSLYNAVAHPALFCIAVFVILFASISLCIYR